MHITFGIIIRNILFHDATIAQLGERLTCNQGVGGSIPSSGSINVIERINKLCEDFLELMVAHQSHVV